MGGGDWYFSLKTIGFFNIFSLSVNLTILYRSRKIPSSAFVKFVRFFAVSRGARSRAKTMDWKH
jgi:hypothetical protein